MKCAKHKCSLDCLGGESAHPSNWYCPQCKLESELSASQAREAELREKLEAAEENMRTAYPLYDVLQSWLKRAETAESANSILSEELQATEAALKLSAAKYNQNAGVTEFVAVKAKELTEHWKQRAEAAEARIKASQEQEPVAYRWRKYHIADNCCTLEYTDDRDFVKTKDGSFVALYAQPPIPPEMAELQCENKELNRRNDLLHGINAELRKLL